MNFKFIILPIIVLSMFSCEKNIDETYTVKEPIISTEVLYTTLSGALISDPGYHNNIFVNNNPVYNASIKLVYNGIVLDETLTDRDGRFSFASQPVPLDGTYILSQRSEFYPNARLIHLDATGSNVQFYKIILLEKTFDIGENEGLTALPNLVEISGLFEFLNMDGYTPGRTMYVRKKNGEIVGNEVTGSNVGYFKMSVPKGEELEMYIELTCSTIGPISLEAMDEDTDLGIIKYDDPEKDDTMEIFGTASDCMGEPSTLAYIFYNYGENGISRFPVSYDGTFSCTPLEECLISNPYISFVILDTKVDIDPTNDTYKRLKVPHIPGNDMLLDIKLCDMDDSEYSYDLSSTSSNEGILDAVTLANTNSNGILSISSFGDWGTNRVEILSNNPIFGTQFTGSLEHYKNSNIHYQSQDMIFTILKETESHIELEFLGIVEEFEGNTMSHISGTIKAIKF